MRLAPKICTSKKFTSIHLDFSIEYPYECEQISKFDGEEVDWVEADKIRDKKKHWHWIFIRNRPSMHCVVSFKIHL